jgi:hypothetical protein
MTEYGKKATEVLYLYRIHISIDRSKPSSHCQTFVIVTLVHIK